MCAFSRSFVYSGTPQVFQAVFAYASSLTLSFGGAVPHVCTLSHLGRSGWQVPFVGVPLCEGELASISISPSCSFSFLCRALPQRFGSVTRKYLAGCFLGSGRPHVLFPLSSLQCSVPGGIPTARAYVTARRECCCRFLRLDTVTLPAEWLVVVPILFFLLFR